MLGSQLHVQVQQPDKNQWQCHNFFFNIKYIFQYCHPLLQCKIIINKMLIIWYFMNLLWFFNIDSSVSEFSLYTLNFNLNIQVSVSVKCYYKTLTNIQDSIVLSTPVWTLKNTYMSPNTNYLDVILPFVTSYLNYICITRKCCGLQMCLPSPLNHTKNMLYSRKPENQFVKKITNRSMY